MCLILDQNKKKEPLPISSVNSYINKKRERVKSLCLNEKFVPKSKKNKKKNSITNHLKNKQQIHYLIIINK